MRILHTADWHLNHRLGQVDQSGDICAALEQIARYLNEYAVDVLLVAGDLFSERSRPDQLRTAVSEIGRIFRPFLQRGGTMLAISGNHDSTVFFDTLREAFDLVAVTPRTAGEGHQTGRLYLAADPQTIRLQAADGTAVQFVLLPYPSVRYLRGERTNYSTVAEKNSRLQAAFTQIQHKLDADLDRRLPAVLVSHIHVRGSQVHTLYKISESDDVMFEAGDVPAHYAYVAYGHIHKPQSLLGTNSHVRYAGSVVRLDGGEREDDKSVVLCEVGPGGLIGNPQVLPLEGPPHYRITITDPDREISTLGERYPRASEALVEYTLHYDPTHHNREELCRQIAAAFPRWYRRELIAAGHELTHATRVDLRRIENMGQTIHDYIEQQVKSPADRAVVQAAMESLLAEEDTL